MVYDFTISRAGEHARAFLKNESSWAWQGKLVCDGYSGYDALWVGGVTECGCMAKLVCDGYSGYDALWVGGVTECGCMAHARRYFFDLAKDGKSPVTATALEFIGHRYGIERDVKDLTPKQRLHERRRHALPIT